MPRVRREEDPRVQDAHFARPLLFEVVGDARVCVRVHLRVVRAEPAAGLSVARAGLRCAADGQRWVFRVKADKAIADARLQEDTLDGDWHAGLL